MSQLAGGARESRGTSKLSVCQGKYIIPQLLAIMRLALGAAPATNSTAGLVAFGAAVACVIVWRWTQRDAEPDAAAALVGAPTEPRTAQVTVTAQDTEPDAAAARTELAATTDLAAASAHNASASATTHVTWLPAQSVWMHLQPRVAYSIDEQLRDVYTAQMATLSRGCLVDGFPAD